MSDNTILVYRAGAFAEIPEPSWRMNGREFAHPSDVGWADAISAALDIEGNRLALRHGAIREVSVIWWQLPDGARYAEFECGYQPVAAVLIPHYPDWLGFYPALFTTPTTAAFCRRATRLSVALALVVVPARASVRCCGWRALEFRRGA